jgi:hypothetical protein
MADTRRVHTNVAPHRWSRKDCWEVAAGCWGFLICLRLLRSVVGWNREGVLYWIVFAPLAAGFLVGGVLWISLALRDVVRGRGITSSTEGPTRPGDEAEIVAAATEFSVADVVRQDKITRKAWMQARERDRRAD